MAPFSIYGSDLDVQNLLEIFLPECSLLLANSADPSFNRPFIIIILVDQRPNYQCNQLKRSSPNLSNVHVHFNNIASHTITAYGILDPPNWSRCVI